jgi:hypothetical protein
LGIGRTRCAGAKTTQSGDLFEKGCSVLSQKHAVVVGNSSLFVWAEDDRDFSDNALNGRQLRQRVEGCCVTKVPGLSVTGAG